MSHIVRDSGPAPGPGRPVATRSAPGWRARPYRVLFPLGLVLAWAGTLHWVLHAAGLFPDYRPVFHAIAQVQGFLTAFMLGFLLTAIPRRTGTPPPSAFVMAAAVAMPVATTVAAWAGALALSQVFWLVAIAALLAFTVRRFRSKEAARRPPNSFVWIPVALLLGVAGSLMTGAAALDEDTWLGVHDLGRLFLLQGMFLAMIAGVGGMILPRITRLASSADATSARRDRLARAGHLSAAVLLVASFLVEALVSLVWGYALRAALLFVLLIAVPRLWRPPSAPGWHRVLVWLSAWMIPAGYALAAAFPFHKKAGLHVTFIGGFALMAFAVAAHVTLAHGGYKRLVSGRPWPVPLIGASFLAAVALRALVDADPARFFAWLGAAAVAFLAGTVLWAVLVIPRLSRDAES